jgi:miniconductance mechanosensitive channel
MQSLLTHWADALLAWLGLTSALNNGWDRWVAFSLVLLAVVLFDFLCRTVLVHGMRRIVMRTKATWDDELFSSAVLSRLCNIVSAIVLVIVLPVVFDEQSEARTIVTRLVQVYIVVTVFRFINALLYAAFNIVSARPAWQNKPINGLRQTGQGIAALICGILIVSILIGKSPAILLTGLGASAAVIMLIFRDSILGFVSGIQLSANDMLKVGDWITVPKYGADGSVIEVSLTTVKVQNWDNTIVTLPPYLLVSDSFQNWRGMQASGGRRVKRSVNLDMTSVKFCTPEMLARYRNIDIIREYIDQTEQRVEEYNAAHGIRPGERKINGLHQTNLGVFLSGAVPAQRGACQQGDDPDGAPAATDRDGIADGTLFLYGYGGVGGLRTHPVGCLRPCAGRHPRVRPEGVPKPVGKRYRGAPPPEGAGRTGETGSYRKTISIT